MAAEYTQLKKNISNYRRQFYEAVRRIALPGDICFFICDSKDPLDYSFWEPRWLRRWEGFADDDNTEWHVGILSKFKKQKKHSDIRPYIIHSARYQGGVQEQHIPPKWIFPECDYKGQLKKRKLMAILRCKDITLEQRRNLVAFCNSQIGKRFPENYLRGEYLTFILGLPNFLRKPDEYACHWLICDAFESIGLSFSHQHSILTLPFFNIARYLGHPLGHRNDKVNPSFPYLRDHHLYRDTRLQCLLLAYIDLPTGDMHLSEYPEKYSWNTKLAAKYNI